ncbi:MAG: CRISPR-associated endonuclease Cas3'' [Candidatus Heimdallarchaeota archaeon]
MNGEEPFSLADPAICVSKSYTITFRKKKLRIYEGYVSHVSLATTFLEPLLEATFPHLSSKETRLFQVISLHDVGKLGSEFQQMITTGTRQDYRHEELAFLLWLRASIGLDTPGSPKELSDLTYAEILAILGHHNSIIDEKTRFRIERLLSFHENLKELQQLKRDWDQKRYSPRRKRLDRDLLSALQIMDVVRSADVLASYVSKIAALSLGDSAPSYQSLWEESITFGEYAPELSATNLTGEELQMNLTSEKNGRWWIQVSSPIDATVELWSRLPQ